MAAGLARPIDPLPPIALPVKIANVSLSLPFGIGSVQIERTEAAKRAAWELFVELQTRISVEPLGENEGTVREALNSLHSLFGSTREILRRAGPDVGASSGSVGGIAIGVLNHGLRPFLSQWHPELQTWEAQRPADTSPVEHERAWPRARKARRELATLQRRLGRYSNGLGRIAGVTR